MSEKKAEYLNFPVDLLTGFLNDSKGVLSKIIHYCIYSHSLKLDLGTESERVVSSSQYFSTELGSIHKCIKDGKELSKTISNSAPKVGLNLPLFWEYYNNEKTEFDKICLLSFLGFKSILGSKPYCKVTNLYLWSRMDGKANAVKDISELSNEIKKYSNRYQTEKIKEELIFNWNMVHYSHFTRGFYVSFKLSLEDLIYEAENKRIFTKQKQQRQLLKEAKEKALERLNSTTP